MMLYSKYINKQAGDKEKIKAGQKAIIISLGTALIMAFILLYLKLVLVHNHNVHLDMSNYNHNH